jgi:hypothetical protein
LDRRGERWNGYRCLSFGELVVESGKGVVYHCLCPADTFRCNQSLILILTADREGLPLVAPFDLGFVFCVAGVQAFVVGCCECGGDVVIVDYVALFVSQLESVLTFCLAQARAPASVADGLVICVEELEFHLDNARRHGERRKDSTCELEVGFEDHGLVG